jgi:plasmid maintenance system killer protein
LIHWIELKTDIADMETIGSMSLEELKANSKQIFLIKIQIQIKLMVKLMMKLKKIG